MLPLFDSLERTGLHSAHHHNRRKLTLLAGADPSQERGRRVRNMLHRAGLPQPPVRHQVLRRHLLQPRVVELHACRRRGGPPRHRRHRRRCGRRHRRRRRRLHSRRRHGRLLLLLLLRRQRRRRRRRRRLGQRLACRVVAAARRGGATGGAAAGGAAAAGRSLAAASLEVEHLADVDVVAGVAVLAAVLPVQPAHLACGEAPVLPALPRLQRQRKQARRRRHQVVRHVDRQTLLRGAPPDLHADVRRRLDRPPLVVARAAGVAVPQLRDERRVAVDGAAALAVPAATFEVEEAKLGCTCLRLVLRLGVVRAACGGLRAVVGKDVAGLPLRVVHPLQLDDEVGRGVDGVAGAGGGHLAEGRDGRSGDVQLVAALVRVAPAVLRVLPALLVQHAHEALCLRGVVVLADGVLDEDRRHKVPPLVLRVVHQKRVRRVDELAGDGDAADAADRLRLHQTVAEADVQPANGRPDHVLLVALSPARRRRRRRLRGGRHAARHLGRGGGGGGGAASWLSGSP
eukprot:Rhum_TRINITY_DN14408_c12_g1::Rhum_TRINITY_DN14408_c12_g1_i1::g.88611::m.88611